MPPSSPPGPAFHQPGIIFQPLVGQHNIWVCIFWTQLSATVSFTTRISLSFSFAMISSCTSRSWSCIVFNEEYSFNRLLSHSSAVLEVIWSSPVSEEIKVWASPNWDKISSSCLIWLLYLSISEFLEVDSRLATSVFAFLNLLTSCSSFCFHDLGHFGNPFRKLDL